MSWTRVQSSAASADRIIGFWRWVPSTRLFYADEPVCSAFGIDPAVGRAGEEVDRFSSSIHCEDRERVTNRIRARTMAGLDFAERYRLIGGDRRTVGVLSMGRRLADRSRDGFCYIGALFEDDDFETEADPSYRSMIDLLTNARDLAGDVHETMLAKLIDAVLLETGFRYARASSRSNKHGDL